MILHTGLIHDGLYRQRTIVMAALALCQHQVALLTACFGVCLSLDYAVAVDLWPDIIAMVSPFPYILSLVMKDYTVPTKWSDAHRLLCPKV